MIYIEKKSLMFGTAIIIIIISIFMQAYKQINEIVANFIDDI